MDKGRKGNQGKKGVENGRVGIKEEKSQEIMTRGGIKIMEMGVVGCGDPEQEKKGEGKEESEEESCEAL